MEKEAMYVTKPFLPPLKELQEYLEDIWTTKKLTKKGNAYHQMQTDKLVGLITNKVT
ncbi:MAG: hypothetical protein LLG40_00280 [Deltaproteobacteria bacterium]|nr:hypothetical protein [Deltaproteobacteria bacterium]